MKKYYLVYTPLFVGISTPALGENTLDEILINSTDLQQIGYHAIGTSTVSRVNVPIIDTPTTINVVTNQLIKDRTPDNLIDALASVSGVSQANTLGGVFDAVQKRGFGGNRDNSIMKNGLQSGPSHNFTATTETIEILKGPASVLYGIQDPGGIVNVITKQPQQTPKHTLNIVMGTHHTFGGQLDLTGKLSTGGAYRFIYDKQKKDYWRNFGKIERTLYAPSLSWQTPSSKILVAYEHLDYIEPFDRGSNLLTSTGKLPDIPTTRRLDEPNNETIGKQDNIQIKFEHKINDTWKINLGYGYSRSLYSYNQARITAINLANRTAVRRIEQQNNGDQRVHSGTLSIIGEFAIGDIANRFILGIDTMRNIRNIGPIYNARSNTATIDIDHPIYTNPTVVYKNDNNNAYQYNYIKSIGAYVQNSAYLTDKLIVTGGLRYEYYDQLAGRNPLLGKNSPNTDQIGGKLLSQLGAVYKFTTNWAFYTNYAESFRPQFSIATPVDSSLKPEEGRSIEVGTKFENAHLNTTIALFNIVKHNVAESITVNNNSMLNIVGKQQSRGLEIDMNGSITDKLGISATYTYTKVKSLKNERYPYSEGLQLSGVPKNQAALFMSYNIGEIATAKIRLGGGARYLGSWYAYNANYTKAYKIPHAIVVDAFLTYDTRLFNKNVGIQLNVKNITNKTYFPSTSGNATSTLIPVSLGYGREFLLNTKIEF